MRGLHIGLGGTRVTLCPDRQPLDLVAAPARKASLERRARHFEQPGDRPILLRNKSFDLAFALDDHAQRNRLDAPRRLGARQFAPQHRREGERSAEHTSELQSLMRISYAVFCLTKQTK